MATKERTITLPEVRAAAKALDPDKTNPGFVLAWGNRRPCCLVGHILRRCGAPLPTPDQGGQTPVSYSSQFGFARGVVLSDEAVTFLDEAQVSADFGMPWGAAIKAGNRAVAG